MNRWKTKHGMLAIIFFILSLICLCSFQIVKGTIFLILACVFLVINRKKVNEENKANADNEENKKIEVSDNDKKEIIEEKSFNEESNLNKRIEIDNIDNNENNANKRKAKFYILGCILFILSLILLLYFNQFILGVIFLILSLILIFPVFNFIKFNDKTNSNEENKKIEVSDNDKKEIIEEKSFNEENNLNKEKEINNNENNTNRWITKYYMLWIVFFILFIILTYFNRLILGIIFLILTFIFLLIHLIKFNDNYKTDNEKEIDNNENNLSEEPDNSQYEISDISYTKSLDLCVFLGWFQVHRFYARLYKSAIIRLMPTVILAVISAIISISIIFSISDDSMGVAHIFAGIFIVIGIISIYNTVNFHYADIYLITRNRFKDNEGKYIVYRKNEASKNSWKKFWKKNYKVLAVIVFLPIILIPILLLLMYLFPSIYTTILDYRFIIFIIIFIFPILIIFFYFDKVVKLSDVKNDGSIRNEVSDKSLSVCLLLCLFLGGVQAHRFYAGLYTQSFGKVINKVLFGWSSWLTDLILIISGEFEDYEGKIIKNIEFDDSIMTSHKFPFFSRIIINKTIKNKEVDNNQYKISDISYTKSLFLCIFLGWFQIHRFYAGLIGSAIIRITISLLPIIATALFTWYLFVVDNWGPAGVGFLFLIVIWFGAAIFSGAIIFIMWLIDLILIAIGKFKDWKGKYIRI